MTSWPHTQCHQAKPSSVIKSLLSLPSVSPEGAARWLCNSYRPLGVCPEPHPPEGLKVRWCLFNQTQAFGTQSLARLYPDQSRGRRVQPHPRTGHSSPPLPQRVPRAETRLTPPRLPQTEHTGNTWDPRSPRSHSHPQATRLTWRTIFRFNGDYSDFPGTLSKRLKVRREGLPLETPTFPGFANFQGALFLKQWSQLLPRPRQAHWLEDAPSSPGKHLGSWDGKPGKPRGPATQVPDGWPLPKAAKPQLCPTHSSYS